MSNIKRNKVTMRCIVAGGTLLTCLGIWASVTNYAQPAQSSALSPAIASAAPENNPGSVNKSPLIIPPVIQSGPGVVPQASPTQPTPVKPAPTVAPAPSPPRPVTTPAPRLRTRGS